MGTFRIRASGIVSQSGIQSYFPVGSDPSGPPTEGAPSNADLLNIIRQFPVNLATDGSFRNLTNEPPFPPNLPGEVILSSGDSDGIYLDGSSTPITENDLPVGFHIIDAQINFEIWSPSGNATVTLEIGALSGIPSAPFFPILATLAYPSIPPLTLNYILVTPFGVSWTILNSSSSFIGTSCYITGTYDIVGYSWTIDTPNPVAPGQVITISSPGGTNPDLEEVSQIVLTSDDPDVEPITLLPADFLTQTSSSLTFSWPDELDQPATEVSITPTLFSGSVLLGSVIVLIVDASGIYVLTPGKLNDTLYIDSPNTEETLEVKIPDPFIKTGFIGG